MGRVPQERLSVEALKAERRRPRKSGGPRVQKDRSLRAVFRAKLAEVEKEIERLKKPWMASKSFLNLDSEEKLVAWVDRILADKSLWRKPYTSRDEIMPVVAVDTETYGLDTRIMVDFELVRDPATGVETAIPIYELNIEIAGVCLSADGIQGVYIPIFHEEGDNVPIEVVRRELQRLFDVSHLVFYNAKFDREVMRQTLGITFRDYPYYEDVQILHYINDPKAKLDDDSFTPGAEGLKGLSAELLGLQQIDLDEIAKVQAEVELSDEEREAIFRRPYWLKAKKKDGIRCDTCGQPAKFVREQRVLTLDGEVLQRTAECSEHTTKVKYKPTPRRKQYVPFTWVPTHIAAWYAAADAICTWLLWDYRPRPKEPDEKTAERLQEQKPKPVPSMHEEAQARRRVHHIDGELPDTIAWIERQRSLIDTERHQRLVKWSVQATEERRTKLRELAVKHGWEVATDDDGDVIPDTEFKVDSPIDLPRLLFDIKGYKPTKFTEKGKRSCDAEALLDLLKANPNDEFLLALQEYKEYVALHPEKLGWDKRDNTARIYLKQAVVAGGRLAAAGGEFPRDGGINLNPQAIKSVKPGWWVNGDLLTPDRIEESKIDEHEEADLHPSCFKALKGDEVKTDAGEALRPDDPRYAAQAEALGFRLRDGKWTKKAPGIVRNHIGHYLGYAICLVPNCKTCAEKHGVLIRKTRLDAAQVINFRALFVAAPGWTWGCTDYSNIEVRGAANVSGEKELQRIFLEGDGDHHALTASKVFPEFTDPNTTAARRKELRSVAKIINFALQYGGTHYTIYQNLKPLIPDITMERTKEMVEAYWSGVPQFAAWAKNQQRQAREEMICLTPFNRIIKFRSLMNSLGLREPEKMEMDNYFYYTRLRKQHRELEESLKAIPATESTSPHVQELRAEIEMLALRMKEQYDDAETGVRNAVEYQRFMGKIQRVALNAPIQGLAGDLMRMSLNRIRKWATLVEPLVQSVFRLHNSVHDEIDYTIKNQYLPWVVPRLTRLMKLRALHRKLGWPVPIEADSEYGFSWDVQHHLTGDADHLPAGWTHVPGMENYLPAGFSMQMVDRMVRAALSGKETLRAKVETWARENLHPRAAATIQFALWYRDKDKNKHVQTDEEIVRRQIIATLQLHEYWTVDNTPDEDEASLETFLEFEQRCGLTAADRGFMPEGGWLFSVPQDRVRRKKLPILGPPPPPPEVIPEEPPAQGSLFDEPEDDADQISAEEEAMDMIDEGSRRLTEMAGLKTEKLAPVPPPEPPPVAKPKAEDDLFYEAPRRRPAEPVAPPPPPAPPAVELPPDVIRLRSLTADEVVQLGKILRTGMGSDTITVFYNGKLLPLKGIRRCDIPMEFREVVHA